MTTLQVFFDIEDINSPRKGQIMNAQQGLWAVNNPTGANGILGIDKLGDAIRFFDPETLAEQKVILHKNHHELAISPDHKQAYASEFGKFSAGHFIESGMHISVLDLARQEIIHRIPTAPFKGPHAMRFDLDGNLWVIFEETGELGLVDTQKMELVATYDIGAKNGRPPFIEITPDGRKIYVSCKLGHIIVFGTEERKVLTRIAVAQGTEGIAISPNGDRLVAAENSKQDLLVIDTASDRIIETIALKGAVLSNPKTSRLIRLRYSPDGTYLVSTNYASGVMHIHDAANPADHLLIPIAKGPQGIAFSADGKHALISNHDCGLFTRVDLAAGKAIECVTAGKGIEAVTYY
jgi:DNA-binding beta-propeller fold protein YncE